MRGKTTGTTDSSATRIKEEYRKMTTSMIILITCKEATRRTRQTKAMRQTEASFSKVHVIILQLHLYL